MSLKGLWEESSVLTWKSIGLSSLHMSSELRRQKSSGTASPVSWDHWADACCCLSPCLHSHLRAVKKALHWALYQSRSPSHRFAGSESVLIFERNENRQGDQIAAGLASAAFLGDVQSRWLRYLQSGEYLFERKKTNLCLANNISVLLYENTFWIYLFSLKYAK